MTTIESVVDAYDAGEIDREQLVNSLTELTRREVAPSLFWSEGLNHVALSVSDIGEMTDFLMRTFGASVIRQNESQCFMACGENNFIGLFKASPVGYNHVCFTVDGYDADEAEQRARDAGLEVLRNEDRVFMRGPDGMLLQVAAKWGDFPLP